MDKNTFNTQVNVITCTIAYISGGLGSLGIVGFLIGDVALGSILLVASALGCHQAYVSHKNYIKG